MKRVFLALAVLFFAAFVGAVTLNSFSITDNSGFTNDSTPTLNISATDASDMAFSCATGGPYTSWAAYATTYEAFTITDTAYGCTAGDGSKTVYAKVKDVNANEAGPSNDATTLDTAAPNCIDPITVIKQGGGETVANSETVSITASCAETGLTVKVNLATLDSTATTKTLTDNGDNTYSTTHTISGSNTNSNGLKTVPLSEVKDTAGNTDASLASDTITLQNAAGAPTFSGLTPSDGSWTNDATPTFKWDVKDNGDGIKDNNFSIDGTYVNTADLNITKTADGNHVEYTPGSNLADGEHSLLAGAKSLTNAPGQTTWKVKVDTAVPTGVSISVLDGNGYTKDSAPDLNIAATDAASGLSSGKMKFSCNNSTFSAETAYAATYSSFSITDTSVGCSTGEGSRTIYIQVKDVAGNFSSSVSDTTFYDANATNSPTLSASLDSVTGAVKLSWNAPSDGSGSGVKDYKVYKSQSSFDSDSGAIVKVGPLTTTSHTDNAVSAKTKYYYRVKAFDKAGNESAFSNQADITTGEKAPGAEEAEQKIEEQPKAEETTRTGKAGTVLKTADGQETKYFGKEKMKINLFFGGKKMHNVFVRYYSPTKKQAEIVSNLDDITEHTAEWEVPGDEQGEAIITVKAVDETNTDYVEIVKFTIDTEKPTVEWVEPKDKKATGTTTMRVKALDSTNGVGIDEVVFTYLDPKTQKPVAIGTDSSESNNEYAVDWQTAQLVNGQYEVKAEAKDKARNSAGTSMKVEVTGGIDPAFLASEKELEEANKEHSEAVKAFEGLKAKNIITLSEIEGLLKDAEAALKEADEAFKAKNYGKAKERAQKAEEDFKKIETNIRATVYKSAEAAIAAEAIEKTIQTIGLKEDVTKKVIEVEKGAAPKRKFEVLEVKQDKKTFYQANVVISFKNTTKAIADFQVIETIPKDFAKTAAELFISGSSTVIEEDPVIKFSVTNVKADEEAKVIYSLKKELSKEEAEKLAAAEPLKTFVKPPIIATADVEIAKGMAGSPGAGAAAGNLTGMLIGILVPLVLLLLVIAAVAFFFLRSQGTDKGESPLSGISDSLNNFAAGISTMLKPRPKEQREEPSKWPLKRFEAEEEMPLRRREAEAFPPRKPVTLRASDERSRSLIAIRGRDEDDTVIRPEPDREVSEYEKERPVRRFYEEEPVKRRIYPEEPPAYEEPPKRSAMTFAQPKRLESSTFQKESPTSKPASGLFGKFREALGQAGGQKKESVKPAEPPRKKSKWGYGQ